MISAFNANENSENMVRFRRKNRILIGHLRRMGYVLSKYFEFNSHNITVNWFHEFSELEKSSLVSSGVF